MGIKERTPEALGAWLVDRLTGERAFTEWRTSFEAAWRQLLEEPLEVLAPPARIEALLAQHLTHPARLEAAVAFYLKAAVIPTVAEMRADPHKLGRWVPDPARKKLLALAAEKQMVQPEWVRSIFREPAIEALVSDTLYRALIDFSTIVPRLIQNATPLGGFARLGNIGTRIVEEIEKRLEPEIRRFLDKGTRRALEGASKFAVDHLDDKLSVEFRRNMLAFALDQPANFHAHGLTDVRLQEVDVIAREIARHVASSPETRTRLTDGVARAAKRYGPRKLGEVLTELGAVEDPPFEEWAALTFGVLSAALRAPALTAYLGTVAAELLEAVDRG